MDVVVGSMDAVLNDSQFLANSANRIQLLEVLTDGAASRRELQDATGVPRSTAARILDDAEARGWIRSEGSRYRITSRGEAMITAFRGFLAAAEGIHHLGPAIEWLPEPAWKLDFQYFREAEVTTPTEDNPTAHFDRAMDHFRGSDSYRGLTQNSLPEYMKAIHDRVVEGQLDFEGVIEANFVDVLGTDPQRAALWQDIAEWVWLYSGRVPLNMHIIDEVVLIWLCDENQTGDDVLVKGLLESTHPDVVSWAESVYEEYRAEAEPLDPAVLPSE
jgi:predicted transcriptional regulator